MSDAKPSFWDILLESIAGTKREITALPIKSALLLLSIPMILEMGMESLFAIVDIYWVAKLGEDAIATVGFTEAVLTIVYSIAIGISMAATAMVARRIGEKDESGARVAAFQVLFVGFIVSAFISVFGIYFGADILALMGGDENVLRVGTPYITWMLGGNLVVMFLFLINSIFRGAGNAAIAMRVLIIANGLNLILDPLLIFGFGPIPAMGMEGAAIASNLGRGVGVLLQLYILFFGGKVIRLNRASFKIDGTIIKKIIKVASGGTGQFIIASSSWIFLMKIMSEFSNSAVAGYTLAIRILMFTFLPAWGMSNAAATLVGQHLGAKQPEIAEQSVWITARYSVLFLGGCAILYFFYAESILSIFTTEADVLAEGVTALKFLAAGFIFFAAGMVVSQAFNGSGDTLTPTYVNLVSFWALQIPLAYFLAKKLEFGPSGVYWAILISEAILSVLFIIQFRKGKWKLTNI